MDLVIRARIEGETGGLLEVPEGTVLLLPDGSCLELRGYLVDLGADRVELTCRPCEPVELPTPRH